MRLLAATIPLAIIPLLSGCVAALLPLAAAGTIGKKQIDAAKAKREFVEAGAVDLGPGRTATVELLDEQPAIADLNDFDGKGGTFDSRDIRDRIASFSGFDSPYADFASYARKQASRLATGEKVSSVVLVPSVRLEKPKTMSCAGKPLAVMIDLDGDKDQDWLEAETVYRQNGLVEALAQLRAAKISVIWLSDHPAQAAGRLASILHEAELAASNADDFLFLDRGGADRKQERRWEAARNYCIVAMAGDKRSDFDELYDYLRNPDGAITLEHMFDSGWFVTPSPLVANIKGPEMPAEPAPQTVGEK